MIHRILASFSFGLALIGLVCAGCGKATPPELPASASGPLATNSASALRFHWIGKKKLATEANATNFMAIWNLPESTKLEAQTLDKLALAPWRLWSTNPPLSNASSAMLRPLLEDLVQEEWYLEARGGAKESGEFMLAVRLSAERAARWRTNLPVVLQSLFGASPEVRPRSSDPMPGLNFQLSTFNLQLSITRSGDWSLLSVSQPTQPSALLAACRDQIAATGQPFVLPSSNSWASLGLDAHRLARITGLNWPLPDDFPEVQLEATGDGENVRTKARVVFSQRAPFALQNWNIPTNLIADPLVSFSAVRGGQYWLRILKYWDESLLGSMPDQIFLWSLPGHQVRSYFTAPLTDAAARVQRLVEVGLTKGNEWLETNAIGTLVVPPRGGLGWHGVPFSSPFLLAVSDHNDSYVFGGLFPVGSTNRPLSPAVIGVVLSRTNLVYYNWELTKTRLESWTYMGQLLRVIFQKSQLPRNSASLLWLNAISTNQTTSATVATLDSAREISVVRRSTMGLTAFELQLLADWLESPEFPVGLHTTLVPPEKRLSRHAVQSTNAPSQ